MRASLPEYGWPGAAGQAANDAMRQQALALEQQGSNAEAEAAWRSVVKAHSSSAEAYAHLGLLEARQERYKEAVAFYRKALVLNPSMPGLRLNLGLALFKDGEMKQAIQGFQPMLKAQSEDSPESQRLTILVGMAHYGLGDCAAAVPYLKQAASRDAQNLQLKLALAHSCLWSKQYECVMDAYREILTLNTESAEADMLAGEAQGALKNYYGTAQEFRAAVKVNPAEPEVHFRLGYILWTQRQYPEAASELKAELANNPNHAQALAYLGDTQMQLNHPELSPPLLEKAIGIDDGLELAHLDLGILDADAGRNDDALKEFKTAAKLAPDDVNIHWRTGRLHRTMGKKDEAKAEYERVAEQARQTKESTTFLPSAAAHTSRAGGRGRPAASVNAGPVPAIRILRQEWNR